MMIFPPYFLVYDQSLLAVPLVMLWSSPAWRWGVALFATTTVLEANLALTLGFSLTGLVALATMFSLRTAPLAGRIACRPSDVIAVEEYACRAGGFPIGRWAFLSRWP